MLSVDVLPQMIVSETLLHRKMCQTFLPMDPGEHYA